MDYIPSLAAGLLSSSRGSTIPPSSVSIRRRSTLNWTISAVEKCPLVLHAMCSDGACDLFCLKDPGTVSAGMNFQPLSARSLNRYSFGSDPSSLQFSSCPVKAPEILRQISLSFLLSLSPLRQNRLNSGTLSPSECGRARSVPVRHRKSRGIL